MYDEHDDDDDDADDVCIGSLVSLIRRLVGTNRYDEPAAVPRLQRAQCFLLHPILSHPLTQLTPHEYKRNHPSPSRWF